MTRSLITLAIVSPALALGAANGARAQAFVPPPQPALQFAGTEIYQANGRVYTRYKLVVANWQAFPNQMFQWIELRANPSRTYVTIRDERGKSVYEFTALGQTRDLTNLWFATEVGKPPPQAVYIELFDRVSKVRYVSNPIRFR
jgi:hypothetical protein